MLRRQEKDIKEQQSYWHGCLLYFAVCYLSIFILPRQSALQSIYRSSYALKYLSKHHSLAGLALQGSLLMYAYFVFIIYGVFHILPQIYTANLATFPIHMYAITVQVCGNFGGTQYLPHVQTQPCSLFNVHHGDGRLWKSR